MKIVKSENKREVEELNKIIEKQNKKQDELSLTEKISLIELEPVRWTFRCAECNIAIIQVMVTHIILRNFISSFYCEDCSTKLRRGDHTEQIQ